MTGATAAGWEASGRILDRARAAVRRWSAQAWAVAGMAVLYVAVAAPLALARHARFETAAFDLGIFDQAVWQAAHGGTFLTTRGMELLAHHANLVLYLFAPLYRLGAGPETLLVATAVAAAAGAVAVYQLAVRRLGPGWVPVLLAAVFLAYPAVQWGTSKFHPEKLAVAPLLWAIKFADERRWGRYTVMLVLALSCKEDVGLAVGMLGLVIAVRDRQRRPGMATAVAGFGWFLAYTQLVVPHLLGSEPFYAAQFGAFGSTPVEVVATAATDPGLLARTVFGVDQLLYYAGLLTPVAFLALLSPATLAIGLPQLAVNILNVRPEVHSVRVQYTAMLTVAVFAATVEGVRKARAHPELRRWVVGGLVAAGIAGMVGQGPVGVQRYLSHRPERTASTAAKAAAVDIVPDGAAVAATMDLVPHLSGRDRVYLLPAPWLTTPLFWGGPPPDGEAGARVGWVAATREMYRQTVTSAMVTDEQFRQAADGWLDRLLTGGQFEIVFDQGGVVVARRLP